MPDPAPPFPALTESVDSGQIDTVLVVFTDMQGRLQGKRMHARYFLDEVLGHGTEGCNYLLAVDVDMNTVDGYEMSLVGARLRRLRDDAGPGHAAARAVAARHGAWSSATSPGSTARRSASRPGSPASARLDAARRARVAPPTRAPSWSSSSSTTPTSRPGREATAPDAGQPLQRRLLDPRHAAGRAAAARHPQRDGRRRADGRVGQGRVQPRPARDRLPLRPRRCGPPTTTSCSRRRQGDRRPARHGADLHGQVRRARGQLLPHPHVPARHRRVDRLRRRRRRGHGPSRAGVRAVRRRAGWPRCRSSRCCTRRTSTPTSGTQPGSFAPTAVALGRDNRTCALRLVGHGSGLRVENRVPGGDVNPYLALAAMLAGGAARHPQRARARSRPSPATPTTPTSRGCRPRCARPCDLFAASRWRERVRRRRRRPLRQRGATSSWRRSRRP